MINPDVLSIIQERVGEMRSWDWGEEDIFWSACGATLKYAETQGQEPSPELQAAIEAAVRQEMRREE